MGGDKYYVQTGFKTRKSERREETEAGRLAAFIINGIPKDFDVYDDRDLNEVHLAQALISTCGRYVRYCPQSGWMVYNAGEGRWSELYAESAVERVIKHFGELLIEGAEPSNTGEMSFARRILSAAGIGAIKNILKHDTTIAVERDRFDAEPDALNCKGDFYNLRTGETRPCKPEDMFSKTTFCKAAPPAPPERTDVRAGRALGMPDLPKMFEDFMSKTTSKDGINRSELALYILSYFGYCLTGDNGASFFVNFHGQGANGKSVLLNLMLELFGSYAAPLPKDLVIENQFQSQFDLAGLPGIRLGVLIDAPEGRLNMDQLKSIVSGDAVNAKRKYLEDFKFKPVCKIAVGSNPRLKLKDTGTAVRRRIRMVPFDNVVPDEDMVINLHRRLLKEEGPQILALLIWFAHEYYVKGEGPAAFPPCKAVDEMSAEYLESEDLVGRWENERTEKAEGNVTSVADLYQDFKKWADGEGVHKIMSKNVFGEHLALHIPNKKRIDSKWHYLDVKLKPPPGELPGAGGG